MFVQGFGEVLASIMTVNPALISLPTASSILDTSNYTFQAVTFGKDAQGFSQHSHVVSTIQYTNGDSSSGASSFDNGLLTVVNYGFNLTNGASSYIPSSTYEQFSSTYNSVPNDPSPLDSRLERASTLATRLTASDTSGSFTSALLDAGHYTNPAIDSVLSSIWNKIGGFAPSTQEDYHFYTSNGSTSSYSFSGQVSSYFNANAIMDRDGYLTVNNTSLIDSASIASEMSEGALLVSGASFHPSAGLFRLAAVVQRGDAATLAAFGGVKHIGVYCLDISKMLASGLLPPYDWNALNNTREYKLVAKFTGLSDLLYHRDYTTPTFGDENSGFEHILNNNTIYVAGNPVLDAFTATIEGPIFTVELDFK